MDRDYYKTPKSTKLMRAFWSASGGDRYILERSTYSDQVKYMCLGGIIVATGIMAALAGGYAFYTIFEPKGSALESEFSWAITLLSIVFGCLWGLMIFNLDRFIVSSTGKGDGTEAITWQEFTGAIPRLVLGAIIAITISKPVEIRMFKSEIDAELHTVQKKQLTEYLQTIEKNYTGLIEDEENKAEKREVEILNKEARKIELENMKNDEMSGRRGTRGLGPEARDIGEQADRVGVEIELLKKKNQKKNQN